MPEKQQSCCGRSRGANIKVKADASSVLTCLFARFYEAFKIYTALGHRGRNGSNEMSLTRQSVMKHEANMQR